MTKSPRSLADEEPEFAPTSFSFFHTDHITEKFGPYLTRTYRQHGPIGLVYAFDPPEHSIQFRGR